MNTEYMEPVNDRAAIDEHLRLHELGALPLLDELDVLWRAAAHERAEPSVAVRGDLTHAGRVMLYYPHRVAQAVILFQQLRTVVETRHLVKFEVGLVERFLASEIVSALQIAAIGVDARPHLAEARLKLALGGMRSLPAAYLARLGFGPVMQEMGPSLARHLWGLTFDLRPDARTETKLYFGFHRAEYDAPELRRHLGDFRMHRSSAITILQIARGELAAHFTLDARALEVLVPRNCKVLPRHYYILGAPCAALAAGAPLTNFNLYTYYRPSEVPSPTAFAHPPIALPEDPVPS